MERRCTMTVWGLMERRSAISLLLAPLAVTFSTSSSLAVSNSAPGGSADSSSCKSSSSFPPWALKGSNCSLSAERRRASISEWSWTVGGLQLNPDRFEKPLGHS